MRILGYVLRVTFDVTRGELVNVLGNAAAKRLKVPLQRFPSTLNRLLICFLCNGWVYYVIFGLMEGVY